jgi:lipopolysaccharide/colanic/teichoic acid biosynthesis glycosyltransferase
MRLDLEYIDRWSLWLDLWLLLLTVPAVLSGRGAS